MGDRVNFEGEVITPWSSSLELEAKTDAKRFVLDKEVVED